MERTAAERKDDRGGVTTQRGDKIDAQVADEGGDNANRCPSPRDDAVGGRPVGPSLFDLPFLAIAHAGQERGGDVPCVTVLGGEERSVVFFPVGE